MGLAAETVSSAGALSQAQEGVKRLRSNVRNLLAIWVRMYDKFEGQNWCDDAKHTPALHAPPPQE